jgi:hypothetical protein
MFGTTRADIATAVTGTWGGVRVVGAARRPGALAPGMAWPLVENVERGPGYAFAVTWNLLVVLSGDEVTAMDQVEALLPPLAAQIEDSGTGYVTGAVPVSVGTQAGELFAVQINFRSE